MLERFRSMMVVVCKSKGLSESQASAVIKDNIRDVCNSLLVAKAKDTAIGKLQVQLVSGIKDKGVIMNEILPHLGNRNLKALSFIDTTKASKSMDEQRPKADIIMADLKTITINVRKFSELIQAHCPNKL